MSISFFDDLVAKMSLNVLKSNVLKSDFFHSIFIWQPFSSIWGDLSDHQKLNIIRKQAFHIFDNLVAVFSHSGQLLSLELLRWPSEVEHNPKIRKLKGLWHSCQWGRMPSELNPPEL